MAFMFTYIVVLNIVLWKEVRAYEVRMYAISLVVTLESLSVVSGQNGAILSRFSSVLPR